MVYERGDLRDLRLVWETLWVCGPVSQKVSERRVCVLVSERYWFTTCDLPILFYWSNKQVLVFKATLVFLTNWYCTEVLVATTEWNSEHLLEAWDNRGFSALATLMKTGSKKPLARCYKNYGFILICAGSVLHWILEHYPSMSIWCQWKPIFSVY